MRDVIFTGAGRGNRSFHFFLIGLFVLASGLWGGTRAMAQYREDKVDNALAAQKGGIFQGFQSGGGNADQTRDFLKKYYLARWTTQAEARNIHTFLRELLADAASISGAGRTSFQNILIEQLQAMAADLGLMPATRYNAVLAIGLLNQSEQEGGEVVPFAPAITALADLTAADKKMPDYILLGALIGLTRHAALGIADDGNRQKAVKVFIDVLEPSFDRKREISPKVAACLQLKAAEGLASLKTPADSGEGTNILDTLRRLIEEPGTPILVQNAAARGIGGMKYDQLGENYDFTPLVNAVAKYFTNLCEKEVSEIETESFRGQIQSGASGSVLRSRSAPSIGDDEDMPRMAAVGPRSVGTPGEDNSELESVLGRVKYDLESVRTAIAGPDGKSGVRSMIQDPESPNAVLLGKLLAQIDRANLFFDYGPDSLIPDFDPKKIRVVQNKKGPKTYYVDIPMMKEFLDDCVRDLQQLSGRQDSAARQPKRDGKN